MSRIFLKYVRDPRSQDPAFFLEALWLSPVIPFVATGVVATKDLIYLLYHLNHIQSSSLCLLSSLLCAHAAHHSSNHAEIFPFPVIMSRSEHSSLSSEVRFNLLIQFYLQPSPAILYPLKQFTWTIQTALQLRNKCSTCNLLGPAKVMQNKSGAVLGLARNSNKQTNRTECKQIDLMQWG